MYRFLLTPRWLAFHMVCLVGVAVMVNLGFWQLRRLDERKDFNTEVEAVIDREPVPIEDVIPDATTDPDGAEWVPVTASGTYLREQIVWFNRTQDGRAGDNVLTPLELDDGDVVLVNRGFIAPPGATPPAPPAGVVEVVARVRDANSDGASPSTTDEAVTEVRRVDVDELAPQFLAPVLPVYVDLISSTPPVAEGDPEPVPAPELSNGPHLSYAVQWFIFSLAVTLGWVLAVRASVRRRRGASSADLQHEPATGV